MTSIHDLAQDQVNYLEEQIEHLSKEEQKDFWDVVMEMATNRRYCLLDETEED